MTVSPAASSASSDPAPTAEPDAATIKSSGFGQDGEYVWVGAVVHNNTKTVGQTVTVNFNVLDAKGNLLKSESQVEAFSQVGADHAVSTQVDLGRGEKAAKVEATVDVDDTAAFSDVPFPVVPTSKVKVAKDDYGQTVASFELSNPLSVALKSPRVGVVCTNTGGTIVGGAFTYPDLVPAAGKVRVDANLTVSSLPARCTAYVGAPSDWNGEGLPTTTAPSSTAPATPPAGASAAAAFKTWLEQFNAKDWAGQYATLASAQQAVISEGQYVSCRKGTSAPKFTFVKVLSVRQVGPDTLPGTKVKMASTKVRVQLSVAGVKTPIDAHMYLEDGRWKWSMTQENISNCLR